MRPVALLVLAAAACSTAPEPAARSVTSSQNASDRATLVGNSPAWATATNLKSAAAATDWVNVRVYLGWQNSGSARALADSVSDPKSSSYGKYLTPQQFRAQFAPSQAQVQSVQQWLTSQGFDVIYTPMNNKYVAAEATVAQAQAAFAVTLNNYTVQGVELRAPSADPSIPTALAGVVQSVVGLDQSLQLVHTNIARDPDATPSPGFLNPQPCAAYWGEKFSTLPDPYGAGPLPYVPCGYTPQQIKGAYGIGSTYDGSGQTVAIIDAYASPTIQQDLDTWSANRGIASTKITQVVAPGTYHHPESGLKQDPQGWYGEETLDVEAVHGMAPGAHIVFVGAPNNFQDLDAAMNHVVDRGLAQIVSNSYGFNGELLHAGVITPLEDIFVEAAATGVGIYFSSGDSGDEVATIGSAQTDWPASSPLVTAVGGTSIGVGAGNTYLWETGWGTRRSVWADVTVSPPNLWPGLAGNAWFPTPPGTWLYGAGGGVSRIFAEPSYQVGVVPDPVFKAQGRVGRAVPDISAFADPNTGYLIGQTQAFPGGNSYGEYRIGGTSLSCPITAGIMALADQARGTPHGFANPALYQLAGTSAVNDVTSPASIIAGVRFDYRNGVDASQGTRYSLRTMNQTESLKTTAGWDDVTGVGTPAAGFIAAMSR